MAVAILDTNVYIDHWERGLYQATLENLRRAYLVRHSAVVLSELRRGARGRKAEQLVATLFELATICWEPLVADWWEAGRLVRNIGDKQDWDINKRRDFQNDALIAFSGPNQPPNPEQKSHPFRRKPATVPGQSGHPAFVGLG